MKKTKALTFMALFIAITIVLKNLTILVGPTKFGFSFISLVISSATLGPILGGVVGGMSDILGFFIKKDGPFFPGFTLSAIIKGMIYGLFLFKRPKSILNVSLAIIVPTIFVDLAMNSLWINMLYGTPIKAIYISKISTLPIYAVLQTVIMYYSFKYLDKEISKVIE